MNPVSGSHTMDIRPSADGIQGRARRHGVPGDPLAHRQCLCSQLALRPSGTSRVHRPVGAICELPLLYQRIGEATDASATGVVWITVHRVGILHGAICRRYTPTPLRSCKDGPHPQPLSRAAGEG